MNILFLFALVALVSIISINDAFADSPQFLFKFGSEGTGNGQFPTNGGPYGIAIDASKNIYVADPYGHRIQKFDSNGNFLTIFGSFGSGNNQLTSPRGVTIDNAGNIFVIVDSKIQKFDSNGNLLLTFGGGGTGIAVDLSGNVYVSDYGSNLIKKFDSSGNLLLTFGGGGTGNGQFTEPYGIAIDASKNIYVADTHNYRIQKFDSNGNFLLKFGSLGSGDGQFRNPIGIVVGGNGDIYVADNERDDIQKFDSNGNFLLKFGSLGSGDGQFNNPHSLVIDSGNLYVSENRNYRIQVFDITSPITPPDGPFTLPCSMQEKGDGVSSSSCYGFYQNSIARAEVGIKYNTGLFPITNYKAVGFFIDKNGNQGQNITVTLDKINPGESKTLIFTNPTTGFVSQFKMQMLGGILVTETPDTIPPVVIVPQSMIVNLNSTSVIPTPVKFSVTATDNVGVVTQSCTPASGSNFPIGVTTVSCTATDKAGNIGKASFTVTVNKFIPKDTDNDGISDSSDSCPTNPETLNGYQDTDGCPDTNPATTDTDGDGISDSLDQCPTQAETVNGFADLDGCPDVVPSTYADAATVEMAKGSSSTSCADKCYIPSTVQIKIGGTVTWNNVDTAAHTVTSQKVPTPDLSFDSGMMMVGGSFDHKFDKAGTYDYYCMVHPWMKGIILVGGETYNPPNDTDGDGILDSLDSCPTQKETVNGYQDTDGCPDVVPNVTICHNGNTLSIASPAVPAHIAHGDTLGACVASVDTDGDGITDSNDKCPTKAETVNGFKDTDGCPDVDEKKALEDKKATDAKKAADAKKIDDAKKAEDKKTLDAKKAMADKEMAAKKADDKKAADAKTVDVKKAAEKKLAEKKAEKVKQAKAKSKEIAKEKATEAKKNKK